MWRQSAPAAYPTLRRHRMGIGLYDLIDGSLTRRTYLEVDIEGELTESAASHTQERAAQSAAEASLEQIVYLGGLGKDDDELSPHLRSRREVEGLLGSAGVPVTVLRAAIVKPSSPPYGASELAMKNAICPNASVIMMK